MYICKVAGCEKVYMYYSSLRKHIRKTHPELKDLDHDDSVEESSHSRKFKIKEGICNHKLNPFSYCEGS